MAPPAFCCQKNQKGSAMKTPMINHQIKLISILLIVLSAVAVACAAVVRADGILTAQEERYGDAVAEPLCDFIDKVGVNEFSMSKAIEVIYDNTPPGIDYGDTADIINYAVANYCPEHWGDLEAFGDSYRSNGYA